MADYEQLKGIADNLSGHLQKLDELRRKYVLPEARQTSLYADEHIAFNREAIASLIGAVQSLINIIAEEGGQPPVVEQPKLIKPPTR